MVLSDHHIMWNIWTSNISRVKKKVKCTLVQALRLCTGRTADRGSRDIALLFQDNCTRRGWEVIFTPRPLFTTGKSRYPFYRRLCGPQGQSGQVQNISPPPEFDPRTVKPVVSRYTDWATRPTISRIPFIILITATTTNFIFVNWLINQSF